MERFIYDVFRNRVNSSLIKKKITRRTFAKVTLNLAQAHDHVKK